MEILLYVWIWTGEQMQWNLTLLKGCIVHKDFSGYTLDGKDLLSGSAVVLKDMDSMGIMK